MGRPTAVAGFRSLHHAAAILSLQAQQEFISELNLEPAGLAGSGIVLGKQERFVEGRVLRVNGLFAVRSSKHQYRSE